MHLFIKHSPHRRHTNAELRNSSTPLWGAQRAAGRVPRTGEGESPALKPTGRPGTLSPSPPQRAAQHSRLREDPAPRLSWAEESAGPQGQGSGFSAAGGGASLQLAWVWGWRAKSPRLGAAVTRRWRSPRRLAGRHTTPPGPWASAQVSACLAPQTRVQLRSEAPTERRSRGCRRPATWALLAGRRTEQTPGKATQQSLRTRNCSHHVSQQFCLWVHRRRAGPKVWNGCLCSHARHDSVPRSQDTEAT